jgi:uncharacterized protein YbaR (Trm112 family)
LLLLLLLLLGFCAPARYKESKIGMRWRTKAEVVSGKGQFCCGSKGCNEQHGLASYEVNFAYHEAGESKQALVKLRVCPACAQKLNYRRQKQYRQVPAVGRQQQQQAQGNDALLGVGQRSKQHVHSRGKHDGRVDDDGQVVAGNKQLSDDRHVSKKRRIEQRSNQTGLQGSTRAEGVEGGWDW